jgi:hypothetical protein
MSDIAKRKNNMKAVSFLFYRLASCILPAIEKTPIRFLI